MKHYFLGSGANYKKAFRRIFSYGNANDRAKLEKALSERYDGEAILTKNGRSALSLALKCYFKPGEKVIVNGFTCFAVIEAILAAELKPIYADISAKDLNFTIKNLEDCLSRTKGARGVIIQNTFGNPVKIKEIEKFAKKNELILIEDLAHAAGVVYPDGREAGTVGAATILSFGKEKAIDTISGGAIILRDFEKINGARFKVPKNARKTWVQELRPKKRCRKSDSLRARYYPILAAMS
ncbi:MAG: aminotransferase class I/II-fold pyridoxal phosphate-dependent enzyme, partial [Candidatus Saccharibacteria bacterium]|nr:aminotransferase class I/II-fold pyridoxal phosphate-dependent enzyme [Candidatus Saccharibacteria bacterium]